ncbi:MAG: hypothetical protein COA43_14710 [Robiginitomaculum sp.]|nr:MAG: hypothetical protein COA43_14710 [Robiginitomaculum sp.]
MQAEFIRKVLHIPWQNRASSFECCDCWGLIVLYYKEVLNITIPEVLGFTDDVNFLDCYSSGITQWDEVLSPFEAGLMFTAYKGGSPDHVGLCIGGGKVLHARGSVNHGGKVQIHSISALTAVYGKISFHRFKG